MNDNYRQHVRFVSRIHRGRLVPGWLDTEKAATLERLVTEHAVESVIEVGSYAGLSACFFAERVASVVAVDIWDRPLRGEMTEATEEYHGTVPATLYETFLENTKAYPNIRAIRLPSLEAACLPIDADLVYLDADHHYEAVVADIAAWRPKARKVLCGDDALRVDVQNAIRDTGISHIEGQTWWEIHA